MYLIIWQSGVNWVVLVRSMELEHCVDSILVHQSNYTQEVLRHFSEDKAKPSSTPMVIRTSDVAQDLFHPKEDKKEVLEPKVSCQSASGAFYTLFNALDHTSLLLSTR